MSGWGNKAYKFNRVDIRIKSHKDRLNKMLKETDMKENSSMFKSDRYGKTVLVTILKDSEGNTDYVETVLQESRD